LGFWIALRFLTIIPSPFRGEPGTQKLGRSLSYFPVVGLVIGGILFGIDRGLGLILPFAVVNALLIVALIILTGALHLDGLIDTCDGLAGNSPERRLEIMSDSHVGAFGIVGVCCLLLLKYAALLSLPDASRMAALLLMPTLSRWTMAYAIFAFPGISKTPGLGAIFKQQATWQRLTIATLVTLVAVTVLMSWQGVVLMGGVWVIILGVSYLLRSRLGGLTGDTYGAANELAEVLVLILLPLTVGIGN
jgi:cobalamin 5''-phosphate synthase/cobalamin synthase